MFEGLLSPVHLLILLILFFFVVLPIGGTVGLTLLIIRLNKKRQGDATGAAPATEKKNPGDHSNPSS